MTALLKPASLSFILSLLLSIIAFSFEPILGRDAALYVNTAQIISEQGWQSGFDSFNWPWLAMLIAAVHQITGLSLISSAQSIMLTFTGLACATLVRLCQHLRPQSGYWAMLIVLSIPAYNSYREEIIREPGFWLFSSLSLLATTFYWQNKRWRWLLIAVAAIIPAALFRLEALLLVPTLCLALTLQMRPRIRHNLLLPVMGGIALLALALIYALLELNADHVRFANYSHLLNPGGLLHSLQNLSNEFADNILASYSRNDAGRILLLGFLGTILLNAWLLCGPFAVSLLLGWRKTLLHELLQRQPHLLIAAALYLLVLMVFFIQNRFMIDRYISYLHLLLTPLVMVTFLEFKAQRPRLAIALAIIAMLVGLSNVVSSSSKRTHYLPTAEWINQHIPADARLFVYDGRVSFYAGRGYYDVHTSSTNALQQLQDYDYLIVDMPPQAEKLQELQKQERIEILADFSNGDQRHLSILRPIR